MRARTAVALLLVAAGVVLLALFLRPWLDTFLVARVTARADAHIKAAKQAQYPGRASSQKPDVAKAVEEYRLAIDDAPGNIEAHRGFISATRSLHFSRSSSVRGLPAGSLARTISIAGQTELLAFYQALERRYPKEPVVQWALGQVVAHDKTRAEAYYRRAVTLDPGFAPGYYQLALLAERVDDRPRLRTLFRKAAEADPSNAEYAYRVATSIDVADPVAFERAMNDILTRLPKNQYAPFILGAAAGRTANARDRIRLLERQHREYPDPGRATSLFHAYLAVDPDKAVALGRTILSNLAVDPDKAKAPGRTILANASESWVAPMWTPLLACGEALVESRRLAGERKFREARGLLDTTTAKWPCDLTPLHLARARIDLGDGEPGRAVDRLIDVVARQRTAELEAALHEYGANAGRTKEGIEDEVWRRRMNAAQSMADFRLARLDGAGDVRLADYRGQVVLVNFWYPG